MPSRRAVACVAGAALVLTALNLRPGVPSFGALLGEVQLATGMSSTLAGLVATLPPICFGLFGLVGGLLGRRFGTVPLLLSAMLLTIGGLAARIATDVPLVIVLFSVPALAGMALGNVLLPVAVRRWFPRQIGRATGMYSLSVTVGTALAAAVSVPIAQAAGSWRVGLGVWAVTPLLAIPPWLWLARRSTTAYAEPEEGQESDKELPLAAEEAAVVTAVAAPTTARVVTVHRHPKTWALTAFFGLQSLGAYVLFGWLPTIYRDAGITPGTAGLLLALVIMLGAPVSILLPELAGKRDDQRILVVGLLAATAAGYLGLLFAPSLAPWVWALLLGLGKGAFPLSLVLIGLRAATAAGTAQLSALSQGVGYLIAAGGPFATGMLYDATGSWTIPLLVLTGLLVPQLWCGLIAAKPGHVDDATGGGQR
jgi:MFS transporter, CP family, cyanate transporter